MVALVDPTSTVYTEATYAEFHAFARAIGLQTQTFRASSSQEIDAVFGNLEHERPDALFVGNDGLFVTHRVQLSNLASRHAIPVAYASRELLKPVA